MPIKIPDSLPATAVLESENIFVMTEYRAMHQDIRPLNVLILNLMPTKVITENQLLRKLSNTPLQIKVEFLQTASYTPQHVDTAISESFYTTFEQVKDRWFDGLIITGAPLAFVPYEKVHYWKELCTIMDWAKTHVHQRCTSAGVRLRDSIIISEYRPWNTRKNFPVLSEYRFETEFTIIQGI